MGTYINIGNAGLAVELPLGNLPLGNMLYLCAVR